jgi:hypothetical protein
MPDQNFTEIPGGYAISIRGMPETPNRKRAVAGRTFIIAEKRNDSKHRTGWRPTPNDFIGLQLDECQVGQFGPSKTDRNSNIIS